MDSTQRRKVRGNIVCLASAFVVAVAYGCVSSHPNGGGSGKPIAETHIIHADTAWKEVEEARRAVEGGDVTAAIPHLLHVISKYPDSKAALDARYWLGVAYNEIRSYREAIELLNEYLRLAPDGKLADEANTLVASLTREYEKNYTTPEELDAHIKEMAERVRDHPGELSYQLTLADLLWRRGNYEESGELYARIVEKHPEYAADETVLNRIELRADGSYAVLSPSEMQRREIEERPLITLNTSAFQNESERTYRESRYYVVTGQVLNRSDSILYGVQVIVTIYGFGNVVYDTSTVDIGRMNPGETRAFSVRFRNFDNISNITRFECVPRFQR